MTSYDMIWHWDVIWALQVLNRLVLERSIDTDPKPTLSLVPQANLSEFWLPLTAFHLGESAKNGCLGLNCWLTSYLSCVCIKCGCWHDQQQCTLLEIYFWHWNHNFTPADWPQNEQCRLHFGEFLKGYRPSAESVETRFPFADSTRQVKNFSVCFNDGFTKVLLMTGICCFIYELDSWHKSNELWKNT